MPSHLSQYKLNRYHWEEERSKISISSILKQDGIFDRKSSETALNLLPSKRKHEVALISSGIWVSRHFPYKLEVTIYF